MATQSDARFPPRKQNEEPLPTGVPKHSPPWVLASKQLYLFIQCRSINLVCSVVFLLQLLQTLLTPSRQTSRNVSWHSWWAPVHPNQPPGFTGCGTEAQVTTPGGNRAGTKDIWPSIVSHHFMCIVKQCHFYWQRQYTHKRCVCECLKFPITL